MYEIWLCVLSHTLVHAEELLSSEARTGVENDATRISEKIAINVRMFTSPSLPFDCILYNLKSQRASLSDARQGASHCQTTTTADAPTSSVRSDYAI
jgi:hypothetical protein